MLLGGKRWAWLCLIACLASGCASDLARSSSGAIGCPRKEIKVSDVSVGWSQMSWVATCRGTTFYCSGEDAPTCAPELDAQANDAPTPPVPEPAQAEAKPRAQPPAVEAPEQAPAPEPEPEPDPTPAPKAPESPAEPPVESKSEQDEQQEPTPPNP